MTSGVSAWRASWKTRYDTRVATQSWMRRKVRVRCKQQRLECFFPAPRLLGLNQGCPETELNRRHGDFQSPALPTELSGQLRADTAKSRGETLSTDAACQADWTTTCLFAVRTLSSFDRAAPQLFTRGTSRCGASQRVRRFFGASETWSAATPSTRKKMGWRWLWVGPKIRARSQAVRQLRRAPSPK